MEEYLRPDTCISCGGQIPVKRVLVDGRECGIRCRHECPKAHEAALKSANTRAYDDVPTRRAQSELQRLNDGFKLFNACGDKDSSDH